MREELVQEALERFGEIFPILDEDGFANCFQICEFTKRIIFWFNDSLGSTHITWRKL